LHDWSVLKMTDEHGKPPTSRKHREKWGTLISFCNLNYLLAPI
jgi:hypothetical protein